MPRVKIKSYDRKKNKTHDAVRTCTLRSIAVQTNSEQSIFEFNTLSEAKYDSLICCCTKDTCGVSCCIRCTQHTNPIPPSSCRFVFSPMFPSSSHWKCLFYVFGNGFARILRLQSAYELCLRRRVCNSKHGDACMSVSVSKRAPKYLNFISCTNTSTHTLGNGILSAACTTFHYEFRLCHFVRIIV